MLGLYSVHDQHLPVDGAFFFFLQNWVAACFQQVWAGYYLPSRTMLIINPLHFQELFWINSWGHNKLKGRKMIRERFCPKGRAIGQGWVYGRTLLQHCSWSAGPQIVVFVSVNSRPGFPVVETHVANELLKLKRTRAECLLVQLSHWHYFWTAHVRHPCSVMSRRSFAYTNACRCTMYWLLVKKWASISHTFLSGFYKQKQKRTKLHEQC